MRVDPARLDTLMTWARLDVDAGLLPSCQIAVAHNDELVAFETYGDATSDHRYILQSAGRPIVAGVVWKLIGDGLLDPGEHVADIIPEFGTNEKDVVTVEHVLTHTAGFPFAPLGFPEMLDRDERLRAFARWRLRYEPGTRLQWHLTSAAWVIAELVERRVGVPLAAYLHDEIVRPLGLTIELGVGVERQRGTIAMPVAVDRITAEQPVDPWGPWYTADPQVLAAGEPSHSIVATAADLALFYQALYHSGLWRADVVSDATRPHVTMAPEGEEIYGGRTTPVDVALFVVVAGPSGEAFLPTTASPGTWGHGGAPCQIGFVDPELGVSFAYLTNGYPIAGYDYSRSGRNRITNIANLAGDLVT